MLWTHAWTFKICPLLISSEVSVAKKRVPLCCIALENDVTVPCLYDFDQIWSVTHLCLDDFRSIRLHSPTSHL